MSNIIKDINNFGNDWFRCTISKQLLKELSYRSNWPGIRHVSIYFLILFLFGFMTFISWGTWWSLFWYLLYGLIYASSNAIWHETSHRTAFRSRALNNFFYHISSFMTNFEPIRWRWSHAVHHSYTASSANPHDYEVDMSIFSRPRLSSFLLQFVPLSGLLSLHKSLQKETLLHALGFSTPVMKECIPENERSKCRFVARIHVSLWITIVVVAIMLNSIFPILFFLIPFYVGWPITMLWALTQHVGLPADVKDHRFTCRSIYLNPFFSFLYWKMEYHIEHHMFPMVPSYNLPKLYELIKDQLPKRKTGLFDAYKEIIPAVLKQSKDSKYFIPVKITE
jgi:fatty acid desaturase